MVLLLKRPVIALSGLLGFASAQHQFSMSDHVPSTLDIVTCPPIEFWCLLNVFHVTVSDRFAVPATFVWNVATYAAAALLMMRMTPTIRRLE